MKRFVAVLSGLLVLPAFAEVAPVYYDEMVGYEDVEMPSSDDVSVVESDTVVVPVVQPSASATRAVSGRTTASRAVPTASNVASTRAVASGRVVASSRGASNAVTARNAATSRSVASRATVARTGTNQNVATRRASARVGGTTAARASIVQTDTVNKSLYSGSRVGTRAAAIRARSPIATSVEYGATTASVSDAVSMDELAQVTDFCKAQYTSCMDNYCNVLDDNQGRCSCSKNIKNYEKTENALKEATAALQDVAQQIQYLGLSGDQIETLFTQTAAELAMSSTSDNTQLKNEIDAIKDMVVNVKSANASVSSSGNGLNWDSLGMFNFNFQDYTIDINSILGGGTANTSSISNQRGEQLYNTAAARCKAAVLNDCSAQGVDISVITNSYDLAIDKQCLVYERSLTEANDNMVSMVRNAKNVLQRARLTVAQNKNAYNMRECINNLDACMQDEYVCGSDYEYCLDPTGNYIVSGEIVVGSKPNGANGLMSVWNYNNGERGTSTAFNGGTASLSGYINAGLETGSENTNVVAYLNEKIGTIDKDGKALGMCAYVLNQCQDYTYTTDNGKKGKEYNSSNNVIKSYMERVLVQIKASQDELLADYAKSCIKDVSSCLSKSGYSYSSADGAAPTAIQVGACQKEIDTCMNLTDATATDATDWVVCALGGTCKPTGGSAQTPVDPTPDQGGGPDDDGGNTDDDATQYVPCELTDVLGATAVTGLKTVYDKSGCKATACDLDDYLLANDGKCYEDIEEYACANAEVAYWDEGACYCEDSSKGWVFEEWSESGTCVPREAVECEKNVSGASWDYGKDKCVCDDPSETLVFSYDESGDYKYAACRSIPTTEAECLNIKPAGGGEDYEGAQWVNNTCVCSDNIGFQWDGKLVCDARNN